MQDEQFLNELALPLVGLFVNAVADGEFEIAGGLGRVDAAKLESLFGAAGTHLRGFGAEDFRGVSDSATPVLQEDDLWTAKLEVPLFAIEKAAPAYVVEILATELPDEFAEIMVTGIRKL